MSVATLDDVSGEPAPTPAARPKAMSKKRRAAMNDHEHLIDLDRAFEKALSTFGDALAISMHTKKRVDRIEAMVEQLLEKAELPVPPKVT
jgi:uncharacterized protein with von Willebrand factor type A (vWA) domain